MKFAPSLLLVLLSLAACTTTSNKRDFYRPAQAHGPWTMKQRGMTLAGRYDHRSQTSHYVVVRQGSPNSPTPPPPAPAAPLPAQ